MKKIYIILLTLTLGACANELDIKPQIAIETSTVLTSDRNVKRALIGAYDGLSGFNNNLAAPSVGSIWGGDLFMYSELLAANGEISWTGTFNTGREIFGKRILTNNAFVRNQWTGGYYTINICNNILSALNVVNEEDRDQVKGEALFIRGAVYFELVRFYSQPYSAGNTTTNLGVPIVLTPTSSISDQNLVSRATVEQTYQQILSDLTTAESLMAEENDVYATNAAASAILSRVYLSMADYENAATAADRVIASGNYQLTDTYAKAFNNDSNSPEDVFAIQVSDQDGNNNMNLYWSIPSLGGRGDIRITDKHLALYEPSDDRLNLFYYFEPAYRSGKWSNQFGNISVVRLAEMYLTRAESNFRLGTSVGDSPANDINVIRERVGLEDIDDADLTLDAILLERKLELAHEGSAIHDLKRLKGAADGLSYDADRMVFPIPVREINANKNLKQNPGYSDN